MSILKFCPVTGLALPLVPTITCADFRQQNAEKAWLFNPFTGHLRDAADIKSDPMGYAIIDPSADTITSSAGCCHASEPEFLDEPLTEDEAILLDGFAMSVMEGVYRSGAAPRLIDEFGRDKALQVIAQLSYDQACAMLVARCEYV